MPYSPLVSFPKEATRFVKKSLNILHRHELNSLKLSPTVKLPCKPLSVTLKVTAPANNNLPYLS
jgi:hypothetical protein